MRLIWILPIFCIILSCSNGKKKSPEGISVFADLVNIKPDDSLSKIDIKIPSQKDNQFWFGYNSDNNLSIENFSIASNLKITKSIWSGYRPDFSDRMVSEPIIANKKIYLLDAKGKLSCRNLSDYKKLWKTDIIDFWSIKNFSNGKISYFENKIFVSTGYNLIAAVDSENGNIIWSKTIGAIPVSAPISNGNKVFVTTNDNKTYALDSKTGEILWIHSGILKNTGIMGAANPVVYNNNVVVGYSSGEIYLLNDNNGDLMWSHDLNQTKAINSDFILNDVDATPIVKDDVIYAIGNGGLMLAINGKNGNILWQEELSSIADFWIAGDFIYLINNDNQLISLYKKTGGVKWLAQLKKYKDEKNPESKIIYNGLIMAGDHLILSDINRKLLIISPLDGKIIKTINTEQKIYHTPIVVDKKLYLHTIGRFSVDLLVVE